MRKSHTRWLNGCTNQLNVLLLCQINPSFFTAPSMHNNVWNNTTHARNKIQYFHSPKIHLKCHSNKKTISCSITILTLHFYNDLNFCWSMIKLFMAGGRLLNKLIPAQWFFLCLLRLVFTKDHVYILFLFCIYLNLFEHFHIPYNKWDTYSWRMVEY